MNTCLFLSLPSSPGHFSPMQIHVCTYFPLKKDTWACKRSHVYLHMQVAHLKPQIGQLSYAKWKDTDTKDTLSPNTHLEKHSSYKYLLMCIHNLSRPPPPILMVTNAHNLSSSRNSRVFICHMRHERSRTIKLLQIYRYILWTWWKMEAEETGRQGVVKTMWVCD